MKTLKNKTNSIRFLLIRILPLCFVMNSCTEDMILGDFPNSDKKIVIDSWITNLSPVIEVRVSYSASNMDDSFYDSLIIKDAVVILSDNAGNSDTLKYYSESYVEHNYYGPSYQTTKIKGVPGRTYHLYVKANNKEFYADTEMLIPQLIDSVYYITYHNHTKNEDRFAPIIKFHDDTTVSNFYMSGAWYGGDEFPMTLFTDELCKKGIVTTNITKTVSTDWWRRDLDALLDTAYPASYNLFTITEEAYKNLEALINQIESDGGLYSPAPGNLPTNIRGGALGFFGALAGSTITYIP